MAATIRRYASEHRRVRPDRGRHRPAGQGRGGRCSARATTPRWSRRPTAGSWRPPTCWSRACTSGATGRRALDVGHKAAAQNLADVAAMGARPTALLVGLAAPAGPAGRLGARAGRRARAGVRAWSAPRSSGATSCGPTASSIAVTALGDLEGRAPVTRAGARAGRRRRRVRPARLVGRRAGRAPARLPVAARAGRRPPPSRRRRTPPGRAAALAGAHRDVRRQRRAARRPRARRRGQRRRDRPRRRGARGRTRRCASGAPRSAWTRSSWVLTGGEDHALVATFPAGVVLPEGFAWLDACSTAAQCSRGSCWSAVLPDGPDGPRPLRLAGDLAGLDAGGADVEPLGGLAHAARTVWMFGFQRRGVRRCEWEMLLPKPGPLPQTSQLAATVNTPVCR